MSQTNIVPTSETGNPTESVFTGVVNENTPQLPAGLRALLEVLSEPGDVVDLDEAVAIVSRHHARPYVQIVAGMNRGLLSADFVEAPWIDREVVIRRR